MKTRSPLLKIQNLHVQYASSNGLKQILRGVNLEVGHGEAVALVGESGSGKSVTALSILQLLGNAGKITQGEVWLENDPLHLMSEKQMQLVRGKKIGMVFQDPLTSLNPTMPIGRQILEGIVYQEGISTHDAKLRVLELLEQVGIADPLTRYHAYPFQLSGGMRQRVAIAIALACRPLLLIADEPTTALDVTVQAQILDLIKKLCKDTGMSLLLITHDLGVVAGVCNRAAVMHAGEIVEEADVDSLFYSPRNVYTKTLLAARSYHDN